jgi:exodeoxyribonuclease VII large subunit
MPPHTIPLSQLVAEVQESIELTFGTELFWIHAEITDVKKYESKRWCFLKFIEKQNDAISTEIKGVFWNNTYNAIEKFEQITQQQFSSGLQINCAVKVRYHARFGLSLEVQAIDVAHTLGELELERMRTLEKLIAENPKHIILKDEVYYTHNNTIPLPPIIQKIALITAPNSDGERDFVKELQHNNYGYAFAIETFHCTVQGDTASQQITKALHAIEDSETAYDVICIVRGGGSLTDFKPFNSYEMAQAIAKCNTPIFTGIGHDSNTSIADMMARQFKTPTKVANAIVNQNFIFENEVLYLKEKIQAAVSQKLQYYKDVLKTTSRILHSYNPQRTLQKGFALVMQDGKIITDIEKLQVGKGIEIQIKQSMLSADNVQIKK